MGKEGWARQRHQKDSHAQGREKAVWARPRTAWVVKSLEFGGGLELTHPQSLQKGLALLPPGLWHLCPHPPTPELGEESVLF